MEKHISDVGHAGESVTEQVERVANGQAVGFIDVIPHVHYTLPDFDKNWRGKFMQMIVDHLHKRGD